MGDILPAARYDLLLWLVTKHPPSPSLASRLLCLLTGGAQGQEKHQTRNGGWGCLQG